MTVSADRRGWGRGWPQNNSSKMVTIRSAKSGVMLAVHRQVAPILLFCIDTVEARGYLFDYGPKDVNDDWGYANRPIRGTSIPSNHSWGLAVDLDATKYPQGQRKKRPPQWVDDIFAKYRFDNGAPWSNPDPMHYEFNGTPADARFLVASLAGHAIDETPAPMPPSAPVVATPPPYNPPPMSQEDDDMPTIHVLEYTSPRQTEVWEEYLGALEGFARNLNTGNGEADALRRSGYREVTHRGTADCDHWKTSINEIKFDQLKARQPRSAT